MTKSKRSLAAENSERIVVRTLNLEWGKDGAQTGNIIVGRGAAHAPGLPFFELRLVQVCAQLLLVRPSCAHGEAPDGGTTRGFSGSFWGNQ